MAFALTEGKVAVFTYSGFVLCSERGEGCSIYLFRFCCLLRLRGRLQYSLIQVFSFAKSEGKVAAFTNLGFVVCIERGEGCSIY